MGEFRRNSFNASNFERAARRFERQVVIVTGSSAGIGQAVLFGFAAEGANVVVHGSNDERIEATKQYLIKNLRCFESHILCIKGEIDREETLQCLVNETIRKFGRIDILVNNAGLASKIGCDPSGIENYDYVMAVNTRAPVRLIELALPYLIKAGGNIINVSSMLSSTKLMNGPWITSFGMSKAALDIYTKYEAQRLAKFGVRINNINPGPVETNSMYRQLPAMGAVQMETTKMTIEKAMGEHTAIGRGGFCEELVPIFLLLADKKSEYLTGAIWVADGGASQLAVGTVVTSEEMVENLLK